MSLQPPRRRTAYEIAGLCALLTLIVLQLFFSVRRESQTWDEANHIFTGYRSWSDGDFGLNPEHPPLVKLLATAPLLWSQLKNPPLEERFFKEDAFLRGKEFLYQNDPDQILARTCTAAAILTLLTALIVFLGTREMFGSGAAFIALTLLAFDPNLLAHGALITTDVGLACFMFLSVYMFYRFVNTPSALRLAVAGAATGLALAVKHTGLLVLPILLLLAACEIIFYKFGPHGENVTRHAFKLLGSVVLIGFIGWVVLWSFYGFRYHARPNNLQMNPPLAEYARGLFLIKSTVAVLVLSLLTLGVAATRRLSHGREVFFLIVPVIFYFIVAFTVGMNIGVRHILNVYVFLYVLIGGATAALIRSSRKWGYAVGVWLLAHAVSSVMAFPNYMAYSNELWGGPPQTYRYLTDSNSDWAQQLKSVKKYLDQRGVKDCWFLYFAEGVAEPTYYGIPCKPLPTVSTLWLNDQIDVPTSIDGPVLISASNLSGYEFGPGVLDPYGQFKSLTPTAVIDNGVFVFDGKFALPLAAAISRVQKAQNLAQNKQLDEALREAQAAFELAPNAIQTNLALADVLSAMGQVQPARASYEKALQLAKTVEPEFQIRSVPDIERRLQSLGQ